MADSEQDDSYYHPGGIPITPQARRIGYIFPVYVSKTVWDQTCLLKGVSSRHRVTQDGRIGELLNQCYEGMIKKLATADDFVYYDFIAFYWSRNRPRATKQQRWKLGARLLLDPSTETPWMYIFAPNVDRIDTLEKGQPTQTQYAEDDELGPMQDEIEEATSWS